MNDLISRQAAIDAVCAVCGNDCDKSEFVYNAPQNEQVILCPEHYVLCTLPSAQPEVLACGEGELIAQPEIVRCKDCTFYRSDGCFFSTAKIEEDGFCSWAERRTDD